MIAQKFERFLKIKKWIILISNKEAKNLKNMKILKKSLIKLRFMNQNFLNLSNINGWN